MSTLAQDEFNTIIAQRSTISDPHPEDVASLSDNDGTTLTPSHNDEPRAPSAQSANRMPSITYTLPTTTSFDANTGPKGVIADARSFETARKRSFRQTLHAFSNGQGFGKTRKSAYDFNREKSPSPDISADDDDEFMREWRAKRIDELARMKSEVTTKRRSPSKRKYGGLTTVDAVGYLDAIEKVSADTIVVVLIYDDQSRDSAKVEHALDRIAQKHVTTRFVKLHQLEAEMDEIAVPGVLAYQGGECFANLVSIMSAMPAGKEMDQSNLEAVLEEHRILL